MGEPALIKDLARRMIQLSGLTVDDGENSRGDIRIEITGMRPGEKLHEELLLNGNASKTSHPRILQSREPFSILETLETYLEHLEKEIQRGADNEVRQLLVHNLNKISNTASETGIENASPQQAVSIVSREYVTLSSAAKSGGH